MRCRFLPQHADDEPSSGADRFEMAAPEAAPEVTYGLQTRAAPRGDGDAGAGPSSAGGGGAGRFQNMREWEAAKLRDDVERLPDVRGPLFSQKLEAMINGHLLA